MLDHFAPCRCSQPHHVLGDREVSTMVDTNFSNHQGRGFCRDAASGNLHHGRDTHTIDLNASSQGNRCCITKIIKRCFELLTLLLKVGLS